MGWAKKSYLGPAKISSFSSWNLSQRNRYDSFWLVVSTRYFYILFCMSHSCLKKLKMVYMLYFKWSAEKTLYRKK